MTVKQLEDREDLDFVSDSQDVVAVEEMTGVEHGEYDSFFVEFLDGDLGDVFGMEGIVPYLGKRVWRVR
jgi:hypothetical protein